jgi:hypothetical protein
VSPPFESATWDGTGSYDADGGSIVSYAWQLIHVPQGSIAALTAPNHATVSNFTPDLAGDYIAELTVTSDTGLTDTCDATLESIPAQDLWVEMFWQHSGDDMDLHLIAPGQAWASNTGSSYDCYYANCVNNGLDWGQSGWGDDNPQLDLDDITGTGPENINIFTPENSPAYTVVVHDYPGSAYQANNDVTVNVYLNGSLVWTGTKTISGEDTYIPFARIDWGNAAVIPL